MPRTRVAVFCWLLCALGATAAHSAVAAHTLWAVRGANATVYLLGSIHVLRPSDYPLDPALQAAYADSRALVMEIDLGQLDPAEMQSQMLASATLRDGRTLPDLLGPAAYARAAELARGVGVPLSSLNGFAPWFAAEAISMLQLQSLGFSAESGVDMYFRDRAVGDHKPTSGLETLQDQIALFDSMSVETQSRYLLSSLEQASTLGAQVGDMVRAWHDGDARWFEREIRSELGDDPALYESLIAARNRKWLPKIEALLRQDRNVLVVVGTGHLVGRDGLVALLARDGFTATQR